MKPTISQLHQAFPEKRDTEKYECDEICERGECIGHNQVLSDINVPATFKNCELDGEKLLDIICDICGCGTCSTCYKIIRALSKANLDDLIIVKEKDGNKCTKYI